ncbi:uncharacterized protein LOC110833004 [Zootermopsis nevadensis]|uniref:uncharacterized protein LOC110833004 n=1 Tax=Zootermopsis nevadensis TaxID=136037 RepID=UPI000B8EB8FF|nr:uncharacterized protein LOC110833004 [Zootermopsis nevadensis]
MMQDLQVRLISAGFTNIAFRIINSKLAVDGTDGFATLKHKSGDIPVLQEPKDITSSIWQSILDGGIDHILVLDRCGRLVYQVISPWSLLSYPYVKAAILSTYNDDPCGPCNLLVTEQTRNNTDTSMEDKTIPRAELSSSITLTKERGTTIANNTKLIFTNNETATTFIKMESEITLNNTRNEESGVWTVMEQTLNKTKSTAEKTSVTRHCNVTQQNQSDLQVRQKLFAADAQDRHNTSNTRKSNMTGSQRNSLLKDGKLVQQTESEQLQNISVPVDSYQKSREKYYDTDQADAILKDNYFSATLSPLIERKDGTVPIRIILHYPHEHRHENGTVSEHEYIVLQTGNPAYHGHLEETVIPEQETPNKDEKGLDYADDDKHTPTRKRKGKNNYGKIKASITGEIRDITKNTEEEIAENIHQHQHKGWKKQKSEQANGEETSEEISQDIRKHGNHHDNTKSSDNVIHFHRGKGRNFHNPGHHKKHKLIEIIAADSTNGTASKYGTTKANGNKQSHVSSTEGRNETNVEVIKSTNRKNSSVESIKKEDTHRRRHGSKKIRYEHHRASVTEKLNANQNSNTNTQNDSSAQQLLIPLSIVWQNAHRPTGKNNADNNFNEDDDSNESKSDAFMPKQNDTFKTEDLQKLTTNTNDCTETNVDQANVNEQEIQSHSSHNKVGDIRKPTTGNMTDEITSSSREDNDDSEIQGDDIIKHYSKLLKWIDYPL